MTGTPAAQVPEIIRPTGLVTRFESGDINSDDFYRELSAALGLRCSYEEFCDIWTSIFMPETLLSDTLLARIADRRRMILLSNTNPIHFEMIRANYPILRHFHELVLSHEVGAMKPLPAIYARAVEAARCRPEECFFTDDVPEYVEGARKFGIDAVQFESQEQVERELKKREVLD